MDPVMGNNEMGKGMFLMLPRFINSSAGMISDVLKIINALPQEETEALLTEFLKSIDGKKIADAINACTSFEGRVAQLGCEEVRDEKLETIKEVLNNIDFGQLRKSITDKNEYYTPLTKDLTAHIADNPIILANLMGMVSPVVNNLLLVVSNFLSKVELPPEVLGGATFNIVEGIKVEALGTSLNELARLINGLHEGNLVMGRNEPRFKEVATRTLERFMSDLDYEQISNGVIALSEDMEVMLQVIADVTLEDPEVVYYGFSTLLVSSMAQLRGITYLVDKAGDIPDFILEQAGTEIRENFDFGEIGSLINALLKGANNMLVANPGLLHECISQITEAIDKDLLNAFLKGISENFSNSDEGGLAEVASKCSASLATSVASDPQLTKVVSSSVISLLDGVVKGWESR